MGHIASSREAQNKRRQIPNKPKMINPKLSWGAFAISFIIITVLLMMLTSTNEAAAVKETKARLLQDQVHLIKESLKADENSKSKLQQASPVVKSDDLFADKLKQLVEERNELQAELDKISEERRYFAAKLADAERNKKNGSINGYLLPVAMNQTSIKPKQKPTQERLQEIHFSSNKDTLSPIAMNKAQLAAKEFLQQPFIDKLKVIGHTDSVGSPHYNFELSKRRAQAVVDVLVNSGVPRDRIDLIAKGESKLPFSTIDEADEPLNRCVGIIAISK